MGHNSLFSLEVAVESLFVKPGIVCFVPTFGFRVLDYQTISIHLLNDEELEKVRDIFENSSLSSNHCQLPQLQRKTGTYFFNTAKSCLFKNNLELFLQQMSATPLYVMLLDVINKDATKLVGTAAISLEKTVRRLLKHVNKTGTIESTCSSGEKDIYPIFNLMGSKIGEVTLGIRITSLGKNLLQHISPKDQIDSSENQENIRPYTKNKSYPKRNGTMKAETYKKDFTVVTVSNEAQTNTQDFSASKAIQFPMPSRNEDEYYPPAMYYEKEKCTHEPKQTVTTEGKLKDKVMTPRKITKSSDKILYPSKYNSTKVDTAATQTEPFVVAPEVSTINQFPVLQALLKEISYLGNFQQPEQTVENISHSLETSKPRTSTQKQRKPFLTGHYKQQKSLSHTTGPLRFGMTNTTKLRIKQVKDAKMHEEQSKNQVFIMQKMSNLQETYTKKKRTPKKGKLISKAVGPNESQLRRSVSRSQEIKAQTVFMEQLLSKHPALVIKPDEATDADICPISSESQNPSKSTEDKEEHFTTSVSLRGMSRQSQRSIEIRLPTASTDFPSEKEYTEEWTASSLEESHTDRARMLKSYDSNISVTAPSDYSEKYSDDFDEERTNSPDRISIKSSRSFDASTNVQDSTDNKSTSRIDVQLSSEMEDDFKLQVYNMSDLPSPVQNPTSQESDSSVSRGNSSVVTALMAKETPITPKKNTFTLPEPTPSDSPVIQSLTTTNDGSTTGSTDPIKLPENNMDNLPKNRTKTTKPNEDIKLPKATKHKLGTGNSKQYKRPSPPSTRKSSPMSSIDSDKYRSKYRHPGRRTHNSSSSSEIASPEPYQRPLSLLKSESVSSYQPSEIPSDLSDLRMSEDIGNLSDILSEEDSQKQYK